MLKRFAEEREKLAEENSGRNESNLQENFAEDPEERLKIETIRQIFDRRKHVSADPN